MSQISNIRILSFLFVFIFIASCTEIIDIDLNSSEPQIVVEGNVFHNSEPSVIRISKSVNFDESNNFPKVQEAIVELSDNLGNSEILVETSPGVYSTNTLTGIQGVDYFLIVQVEGQNLSSSSLLPFQVAFDSLIVTETSGSGGPGSSDNSTNYEIRVEYTDPADEKNYYRFVEFINGKNMSNYAYDDRLNDGLEVSRTLLNFDRSLKSGDTLRIEMQCIDIAVYEYFNSSGNSQGGGPSNSATPANPITNIEGAELGYFSAHTTEIKQVIIQ